MDKEDPPKDSEKEIIQILSEEKALFRALKEKQGVPKYGLIYDEKEAPEGNKGKMARVLAAKASLSARVDSLGDDDALSEETRGAIEARLRNLELETNPKGSAVQ